MRINEMLSRLGSYPVSYYRDIYREQATVQPLYRRDRDGEVLTRCDGLALEPRAPHRVFAGRLAPRNEAALLLKHAAFRDRVAGRDRVAAIHRQLADLVYTGDAPDAALRESPLYSTLREILG